MTRFVLLKEKVGTHTVYKLFDTHTEANAVVVPQLGNNCLQFHAFCGDKLCKVIDDLSFLNGLTAKPARYGISVLFPWAGTVSGGVYRFAGKEYRVVPHSSPKDFHHGFVNRLSWEVLRFQESDSYVSLTCRIKSADCTKFRSGFPWDFQFEMTYKLDATGLICECVIDNLSQETMPLFLGFHPYFIIEETSGNTREKVRLDLSAVRKEYQLKKIVGEPPPKDSVTNPVNESLRNPKGFPMEKTGFNNVFLTDARQRGKLTTGFINPDSRTQVRIQASGDFETLVVFTPSDRAAVSLEPWTATVDAFNLAERGVPESGLKTIAPGKSWSGEFQITAERISYTNQ